MVPSGNSSSPQRLAISWLSVVPTVRLMFTMVRSSRIGFAFQSLLVRRESDRYQSLFQVDDLAFECNTRLHRDAPFWLLRESVPDQALWLFNG